jgi:esterase/PHB depolymerase
VRFWHGTAGLLRRLFRRPPLAPGRFSLGQKSSLHGFVSVALAPPWREYLLYLPRGHDPSRRRPLVVWLHGCQQDPEAFAEGSRIAAFADDGGFIVLLPRQNRLANSQRCWNWFDPRTAAGAGEAAIVGAASTSPGCPRAGRLPPHSRCARPTFSPESRCTPLRPAAQPRIRPAPRR